MAQCKQSPQEFIKNSFTPQIAVLCTESSEKICQKNNLNFIELLQPFSKLNYELYYKDPTGNPVCVRDLKLNFLEVESKPPQPALARKYLNSSVSDAAEPKTKELVFASQKLELPSSTPWFEAWKNTFLRVQYPSDHEYTKHFLACVLVVSSTEANPVETIINLAKKVNYMQVQSSMAPGQLLPKWFNSNVLKYYVILHDNNEGQEEINRAIEAFESLKNSFGSTNCFLLRMNSRPPGSSTEHLPDPWSQFIRSDSDDATASTSTSLSDKVTPESSPSFSRNTLEVGQEANEVKNVNYHPLSPDNEELTMAGNLVTEELDKTLETKATIRPHGSCLSTDDIEQVKLLIQDFSKSCLLPYIEKQIASLSDVVSNKKGMSKSLFSATKRWFSPNKPGASSVAVSNLIYAPDSPELQVRKLGDLYFMFGHYSLAFQAYHLAKRDYNTDQAWLYYAGALEMASLAAFMANESNRKTCDYMEESITTYLSTCKMPQFATRATIISCECLKSKNMFGEAAHQFIRMTSEESDLRSALLLEQAAYCFLESKMLRKYAFHMVLSGHRFSKAAQKKHSLRCYKQAYQIYRNTGWDLASDHINYTIGRQANNLQQFREAVQSFSSLLNGGSKQSAQQQAVFLKEYLTILGNQLKNENSNQLPCLPVPELDVHSIKVLVGPTQPLSTPGKVPALGISFTSGDASTEAKWNKLEEMLVTEAIGSLPMVVFKPMTTLYTINQLAKINAIAVVKEPIQISVQLTNSLQTVLNLKDIYLLWCFNSMGETVSNETDNSRADKYMKTHINKSIIIQGNLKHDLVLSLTPLRTGTIKIVGICYTLSGSSATETIFTTGKQLINISAVIKNNSKKEQLEITVVPSAPCLQITFSEMNLEFLTNEVKRVTIDFQNTGSVPLKNIYMATSAPHLLCNCDLKKPEAFVENNVGSEEADTPALKEKLARKNHITTVPLAGNELKSGETTSVHIWVKAPTVKGPTSIDLLIYYENIDSKSIPRYRLVRHSWNLTVQESISVHLTTQNSYNSKTVEELALAIKATNLNQVHQSISTEVRLLNVCLLSRHWTLTKDMVTPKFINLNSKESAHILLKAKRILRNHSEFSNISLTSDDKSVENFRTAYLGFARKTEERAINIFDGDDSDWHNKPNREGLLLLQWQALITDANSKRIVNGQSHIPLEIKWEEEENDEVKKSPSNGSSMDISEKIQERRNPMKQVTYNLVYPAVVKHDFSKDKICIVPVKLLLHSTVEDQNLTATINTLTGVTGFGHSNNRNFSYQASGHFGWLGNNKLVRSLRPLSTDSVQLSVVVAGPGTYDLGAHLEIFSNELDSKPSIPQNSSQNQSALIVVNVDS